MKNRIGQLIHDRRVSRQLTQAELAAVIRVSRLTLRNWEAGLCLPSTRFIGRLSKALDAPKEDLI